MTVKTRSKPDQNPIKNSPDIRLESGVIPVTPRRELDAEWAATIAEMVVRRAAGDLPAAIAAALEVSIHTVYRHTRGMWPDGRAAANQARGAATPEPEWLARARTLQNEGYSRNQIVGLLGVPHATLYRWLASSG